VNASAVYFSGKLVLHMQAHVQSCKGSRETLLANVDMKTRIDENTQTAARNKKQEQNNVTSLNVDLARTPQTELLSNLRTMTA